MKSKAVRRTLYECCHARVLGSKIYCNKGHQFTSGNGGCLRINHLARGSPLAIAICQNCSDFDCMGTLVSNDEKGWLELKTSEADK